MAARRTRLARARKAAGFTQEGLAFALHDLDRSTIYRWESGKTEPQPYVRPKLAKLLDVTLAELESMLAPEPTTGAVVVRPRAASSPAVDDLSPLDTAGSLESDAAAGSSAELVTMLTQLMASPMGVALSDQQGDTEGQLVALLRRWVSTVNRREILQLLGWVMASGSSGIPIGLNSDEQERVARALAAPRRVDGAVIEHIQTVYWSCRRQDDALGPQAVLPTVLAQLSLVDSMMSDCPSHLRSELFSTYSGLAGLAGWLYADTANYQSAWTYLERARNLAHEARDPSMASFTLARMSHTAQMQSKAAMAIDYAEAARRVAAKSSDSLVRVHASSQTARAYAKSGDAELCLEALDEVETGLAAIRPQDAATSLAYFYDSGSLSNAKAICFLELGRPLDAATEAKTALAQHEKALVRDNAFTMLYLAQAHIQLGEVDEAATVTSRVVEATTQNRSVRLRERLHDTRGALEPWRGAEAVRVLDERLRDGR